jgi:DNA-nicking Smr family endonuclease
MTRRRRVGLSSDDIAVWHHVARQARPLPGKSLPELPPVEPPRQLGFSRNTQTIASPSSAARPLDPKSLPPLAPLERRQRRDITRGFAPIDARIDLHGMRQAEAHHSLLAFLHRAHHVGWKLVLVITGKGGSPDPVRGERGVLRRLVPHWLADPVMRDCVLGYEPAALPHGGDGALYVRIRRRRTAGET